MGIVEIWWKSDDAILMPLCFFNLGFGARCKFLLSDQYDLILELL